jgi:ferrous iron transport protein B
MKKSRKHIASLKSTSEDALPVAVKRGEVVVALAGNPNSGKTTLFNALTGARQHTANYPGVTVEIKEGIVQRKAMTLRMIDLPGTYSLSAHSEEEIIARDLLLEKRPDIVVHVIDSSNLERNLYLLTELLDLGLHVIIALNMYDELLRSRAVLRVRALSQALGVPVIPTIGHRGQGLNRLLASIMRLATEPEDEEKQKTVRYGETLEGAIAQVEDSLRRETSLGKRPSLRWLALKLLEGDPVVDSMIALEPGGEEARKIAESIRERIWATYREDVEVLMAEQRYGLVAGLLRQTWTLPPEKRVNLTSHLDRILTHTYLGIPLFLFFMWALFQLTFSLGAHPQAWIESGIGWLSTQIKAGAPPGPLRDLVTQGILGGVGGVAIFLPNIIFLFFGMSLLEDTGYMARAAFLLDRVMHSMGLHGKSFIPLLMGFGCNVPAIMATRTLETRRDRLLTNLLIPLMSCSARFYVYVLFAGAFFPGHEGNVIFSLYVLSILTAIGVGQLLGRTAFRQLASHFVLELPPYRFPTARSILIHVWVRVSHFLKKMGGYILAFSVIIWFLGIWPKPSAWSQDYDAKLAVIEETTSQDLAQLHAEEVSGDQILATQAAAERAQDSLRSLRASEQIAYSALGRIGGFFQPVFEPLGFTREMTIALVAGAPVKEVVVSTLGVIYGVSSKSEEGLRGALRRTGLPPLVAYAYLVFILFYFPCIGTLVAFYRETGSKGWTVFLVGYELALAWGLAFLIVQGGALLGLMG